MDNVHDLLNKISAVLLTPLVPKARVGLTGNASTDDRHPDQPVQPLGRGRMGIKTRVRRKTGLEGVFKDVQAVGVEINS